MAQAQIEANKRFRKKSYDRSVNAFIKEALAEYIAHTTKQ